MNEHKHMELPEIPEEDNTPELLELETLDGGTLTLEVLSQLSYGGQDYLVAAEYTEAPGESTALYFFTMNDESLVLVEDEALLDTLLEIFTLLSEDEED